MLPIYAHLPYKSGFVN